MGALALDERSHHLVDLASDAFGEERSAHEPAVSLEADGLGERDGSGDALGSLGEADEILKCRGPKAPTD